MFCILYLNVSLYQFSTHSELYNNAGLKPLAAPPFPYVAKRIYMANKNCYIQIAVFPCKYFGANILHSIINSCKSSCTACKYILYILLM